MLREPPYDPSTPNVARIYDYWLGGKDHGPADRELAEELRFRYPEIRAVVRENRAFLSRVVRYLAGERGIRQFIDIGTGLPTRQNVHEVAQEVDPGCRVVYVDYDRPVVRHAQALLAHGRDLVGVVEADVREPAEILGADEVKRLVDFSAPVAILMLAVLHFVPDRDAPQEKLGEFVAAMAPGSMLAISHAAERERLRHGAAIYTRRADAPAVLRSRAGIARFFDGLRLVEPGLVAVNAWRPEVPERRNMWLLGGVGEKC